MKLLFKKWENPDIKIQKESLNFVRILRKKYQH